MALTFRFAQETDTLLILQFIRELADYEHLLDQVVADEATLRDQLFEKRRAGGWRPSPRSGTAAAWSGGAWTGTPPASASTSPWGRRPWRTGPFTALPNRHCRGWQNRNLRLRKPMRFDILESH